MHALILVAGAGADLQMHRFADYRKVDPYRVYLSTDEVNDIAQHYSLSTGDLHAISEAYEDWAEEKAFIDDKGIYSMSRQNPEGKFDWFQRGGTFSGYLRLREERHPGFIGKIFGKKSTRSVDVAMKHEICESTFSEGYPTGILHKAVWSECPITSDVSVLKEWDAKFIAIYKSLPEDIKITVMDIHC